MAADPYVYPDAGLVLRNLLDERDGGVLAEIEYDLARIMAPVALDYAEREANLCFDVLKGIHSCSVNCMIGPAKPARWLLTSTARKSRPAKRK